MTSPPFCDSTQVSRFTWEQLRSIRAGQSAFNPFRVIAHIDLDAFYAQVEQVRLGIDRSVPFAVRQWDGLIAVNYAARAHGVTRFTNINEACHKCPGLRFAHVQTWAEGDTIPKYRDNPSYGTEKVSLDPYRRAALKIQRIFRRFCDCVQRASIDESFLDLSNHVKIVLCERYLLGRNTSSRNTRKEDEKNLENLELPKYVSKEELEISTSNVTSDKESLFASRLDAVNDELSKLKGSLPNCPDFEILKTKSAIFPRGPNDIPDETQEDNNPNKQSETCFCSDWDEVAMIIGCELVSEIRKSVLEELGYTSSAGISINKTVAKLASGFNKPNNQTTIFADEIQRFMARFKVSKIRFLGGKLGDEIIRRFETDSVAELQKIPPGKFRKEFGDSLGRKIYAIICGYDIAEVEPSFFVKSMLAAKSFRPPLKGAERARNWLKIFAADLFSRLADIEYTRKPSTLSVGYRQNFVSKNRQRKIPIDFDSQAETIEKLAIEIFDEILKELKSHEFEGLGVTLHDFSSANGKVRSLDYYFQRKCINTAKDQSFQLNKGFEVVPNDLCYEDLQEDDIIFHGCSDENSMGQREVILSDENVIDHSCNKNEELTATEGVESVESVDSTRITYQQESLFQEPLKDPLRLKKRDLAPISESKQGRNLKQKRLLKAPEQNQQQSNLFQSRLNVSNGLRHCTQCGMSYQTDVDEDRQTHEKYHDFKIRGTEVSFRELSTIWKDDGMSHDKVVRITKANSDPSEWRITKQVLEHVSREAGGSRDDLNNPQLQVFMFVRNRRCAGLLLAEKISSAKIKNLKTSDQTTLESVSDKVKFSAVNFSDHDAARFGNFTERTNNEDSRSSFVLGVSKVWVQANERRKGIATLLLELARFNFVFGAKIDRQEIAFCSSSSEPARRWMMKWSNDMFGHGNVAIY